jgi:hypothetical protein
LGRSYTTLTPWGDCIDAAVVDKRPASVSLESEEYDLEDEDEDEDDVASAEMPLPEWAEKNLHCIATRKILPCRFYVLIPQNPSPASTSQELSIHENPTIQCSICRKNGFSLI